MGLLVGLYLQYKFYNVKIMIKKMVSPLGMAQEMASPLRNGGGNKNVRTERDTERCFRTPQLYD